MPTLPTDLVDPPAPLPADLIDPLATGLPDDLVDPVETAPAVALPDDLVPPPASALPDDLVAPGPEQFPLGNPLGDGAVAGEDWTVKVGRAIERANSDPFGALADSVAVIAEKVGLDGARAGRFAYALLDSMGPLGSEFIGAGAPRTALRAPKVAGAVDDAAAVAKEAEGLAAPIKGPAEAIRTEPPTLQQLAADVETRGTSALDSSVELDALRKEANEKLGKMHALGLDDVAKRAPDATEPIIKETLSRDVNQTILELLEAGEVKLAPDIKISDQVRDLLQANVIEPDMFRVILARNGVDPVKFLSELTQGDLGAGMRESATQSARTLQKLSELRKVEMRIRALAGDQSADVAEFLAREGADDVGRTGQSFVQRVGQIWKGSLVSQVGTAMRNVWTTAGRVGMDVYVEGLERGLRTVFGNPVRRFRGEAAIDDPLTAWGDFVGLMGPRRALEITKSIADVKPLVRKSMFASYAGDVARASGRRGILGTIERGVDAVNFFNRVQDKMFRSSIFAAELRTRMSAKGLDLDKAIGENKIGSIPEDMIKDSITAALDKTWAAPMHAGPLKEIALGWDKVVTLGGKIPNTVTPFLRFMVQSLRWQFEHSPLGATALMKPSEIKGLVTGNPKQLKVAAKALAGTSLLYGAYMLRNSSAGGPLWYEINLPDGRTIDARPFAPFSTYLFVADLIKRQQDGTLLGTDTKALAQGLIGTNFRAGAGLYLVDQLIDDAAGVNSVDKMANVIKNYTGNVLAGFAVPFQTLKDVIGQFVPEERVLRETRESPFTGPIRARIPFAAQTLPEAESPTRAANFEREQPLLRQIPGVSLRQAPNAAEAELGRLNFKRREILPATGDIVFDRLMAKHLGPLVESQLGAIVQTPGFQKMDNFARAEVIRQVLPKLRDQARAAAYLEDQGSKLRLKYKRLPRRQRALIESILEGQGKEINLPQ
jgi:hypothetical protein